MYPSPPKPRRVARVLSVVTAAAILATTGCSALGGGSEDTTRVLQSVAVKVGGNGAIAAVDSSAVFLDEATGLSRSETVAYETRDVVADLPVRVSTSYRTDEGVGQNLADLDGYDGHVEIRVELENLTVTPMELQFDAAGQSRTSPALVGTPLSIAASTVLADIAPENLAFGDGEASTSGVVSVNDSGETVVQWATVLAPPQSRATTAFTLVADVTDFTVPAIDIAVQAGLHTDLSFEGTVVSALDGSATSELGMQQRAISLVTEVNGVLSRAGGTITEVRKDLGETSKTLGVRAAKRLADSTEALGAEMQTLGAQLGSLQKDLGSTVTSTHLAMDSQLTQIVGSMTSLLGDTRGTPSRLVTGNGCVAKVEPGTGSGSLYSTFLQLAGQLNGYADATEQCKGEILAEITATLGPDTPDAAVCAAETETSMTCSLFGAKQHVLTSMADLVAQGQTVVANLSTPALSSADDAQKLLAGDLAKLETLLMTLGKEVGDETTWNDFSTLLSNALASAHTLDGAHAAAQAALADLDETTGALGSLPQDLADRVCDLNDGSNVIDQAQLETLRGELVDTQCDGVTPQASTPVGGTLESRLEAQRAHLEQVATLTDPTKPKSALSELKATLADLQTRVASEQSQTSGGTSSAQKIIADLQALKDAALGHNTALGTALADLVTRELGLETGITDAFATAANDAELAVSADVEKQVRTITDRVGRGRDTIENSYTETVDGLRSTSDTLLSDAKTQIDAQKSALDSGYATTVSALDERTGQALERIDSSTAASTRDVEAASKMLSDSLNRVILDLGDPAVRGSGILGAMSASAAKSSTADFQLALASQQASGFANVRAEDIAAIMLRQAQFEAALESAATLPAFHLDVPGGASSQTIYGFHIGGGKK